ncbi:MAG: S1 RNA-binding domain-containing protein [Oscillospiraceae bacterium]
MDLTVGAIIEGKVKSITNFGAFIALPENKTGMVHISEVANAYVNDIRQYLTEGQDVKVMVIALDPAGKINLSMKRLEPKPRPNRQLEQQRPSQQAPRPGNSRPHAATLPRQPWPSPPIRSLRSG